MAADEWIFNDEDVYLDMCAKCEMTEREIKHMPVVLRSAEESDIAGMASIRGAESQDELLGVIELPVI
jgi:hypothetical protein